MPQTVKPSDAISYLQQFLTYNKARGMVAELSLSSEIAIGGTPSEQKLFPGGWLLSPKTGEPHAYRYMAYPLPNVYNDSDEIRAVVKSLEQNRGWQALAQCLSKSGIGIIVSGAWSNDSPPNLNDLSWCNFIYRDERLHSAEQDEPFSSWRGIGGAHQVGMRGSLMLTLDFAKHPQTN